MTKIPLLKPEVRNCPWSFWGAELTFGIDMDEPQGAPRQALQGG